MTLAVVIPTLNEQASIALALRSLHNQSMPAERVILSDGHSTDRTTHIAKEMGAEVLYCPRIGRGEQIADAVERLEEDLVLIAHADMTFPPEALARVRRALSENPQCPGGCLGHRFERRSMAFRMVEIWDRLRAARGKIAYGDQAQFFRRQVLEELGGFPDQPIMEDLELSQRLKSLGRPMYLNVPVTISCRRFLQLGHMRTLWTNHRLRQAYHRGGLSVCWDLYESYYRTG